MRKININPIESVQKKEQYLRKKTLKETTKPILGFQSVRDSIIQQEVEGPIHLSFSGCGFLCGYHVGAVACLRERGSHILSKVERIYGSSAGALIGACVFANIPSDELAQLSLIVSYLLSSAKHGILDPSINFPDLLKRYLHKNLPDNIHETCKNKLFINLTSFPSFKPFLVSEYNSKEDLIDALICTSFIPLIFGISVPKFRGKWYIDGGLTDNLPRNRVSYHRSYSVKEEMLLRKSRKYCENIHGLKVDGKKMQTITVAPFSGEGDICPRDVNYQSPLGMEVWNMPISISSENICRIFTGFISPSLESVVEGFIDGYNDTQRYLETLKLGKDTEYMIKKYSSLSFKLVSTRSLDVGLTSTDGGSPENISPFFQNLDKILLIEPNELVKKYEIYYPQNTSTLSNFVISKSIEAIKCHLKICYYLTTKSLYIASPIIQKSIDCAIPIIKYLPKGDRLCDFFHAVQMGLNELKK